MQIHAVFMEFYIKFPYPLKIAMFYENKYQVKEITKAVLLSIS